MREGAILDRALEPAWLDLAMELARDDGSSARARLEFALRDRISASEGRKKTVRVLTGTWLSPPESARPMVRWALERSTRIADSRLLHVGALLATYPFFGEVCAAVGREIVLNGQVRYAAIRQHVRSRWGDREMIDVSARAAIRTLRSMGVVEGTPGRRTVGPDCRLDVPGELAPWMYHALMLTRQAAEMDLQSIQSAPEFFMLRLPASIGRGYPLLERLNEGGGRSVLRLVVPTSRKPPTPGQLILFDQGTLNRAR